MKSIITLGACAAIGLGIVCAALLPQPTMAGSLSQDDPQPLMVGTYDSRAIAIAYVRSDDFQSHLKALHAELETAKAAGDDVRAGELEALGPALQKQIHEQGFGSAPIDNIMAKIEGELPGLARENEVDLIVSKWELDYLQPGAQTVDLSLAIAEAFEPDEATRTVIADVLKTEPVPLDQLDHEH